MDENVLDITRACALHEAFHRNDWSEEEIASLSDDLMLARVRTILGLRKDRICAADPPFVPDGWTLESHSFFFRGQLDWDGVKASLHYEPAQVDEGGVPGAEIRRRLESKQAMNASVLDFLLARPHLIPSSWKGALVHFWGTTYRDPGGFTCVRHLRWNGESWCWGKSWVGDDFGCFSPAAVVDDSTPEPEIELPSLPCDEPLFLCPELDLGEEPPFLEGPPEPAEQLTLPFARTDRPTLEAPSEPTVERLLLREQAPVDPDFPVGDEAIAEFLERIAFDWDDRVVR